MRPPTFQTPGWVWFSFAAALIFALPASATADLIWINEFHYDNLSTDTGEFVEVVALNENGFSPPDIGAINIELFDASGILYDQILLDDSSIQVTSTVDANYYVWNPASLIDGVGGIALNDGLFSTSIISYGGVITAVGGLANGNTSTNVGLTEDTNTMIGETIGLTGNGTDSADFTWDAPLSNTSGGINEGQSFGTASVPEPTQGWLMVLFCLAFYRRRNRAGN